MRKSLLLAALLAANSWAQAVPSEVLVPSGAQTDTVHSKNGKFQGSYKLKSGKISDLAAKARAKAEAQGYKSVENQVSDQAAALVLEKGDKTLQISIDSRSGAISYVVKLEQNGN